MRAQDPTRGTHIFELNSRGRAPRWPAQHTGHNTAWHTVTDPTTLLDTPVRAAHGMKDRWRDGAQYRNYQGQCAPHIPHSTRRKPGALSAALHPRQAEATSSFPCSAADRAGQASFCGLRRPDALLLPRGALAADQKRPIFFLSSRCRHSFIE
uniref:Uncharacterized protein n=1 Tax=Prymnesium polylepis TaxID=72548 RepID=A0A7S4M4J6_9EUKA|mmetsp:Transcript_53002/g.146472  ORF Transcript_53002/g.146472 Transcript_53002/m.146472 type:complete len:153 (+) Transcript_53002:41-499(+)